MIDYKRKIVFVHVPRTSGTSIEAAFGLKEESKAIHHYTTQENYDLLKRQGEDPDSYYWFSLVRNPWDKVISAYHQKTNRKINQGSLAQFIRKWKGISGSPEHSVTQTGYLNRDDINIFYFENRDEIVKEILKITGIDLTSYHVRKTKRERDYRVYYNEETKQIVAEMFKKDIERFGYAY